jgi:CheY-like chemotaxis protein
MKPRVLVVDDSALSRRTLRQILEPAGYEVAEAEDGLTALERYFIEKPDVVLLDLVMKGMYWAGGPHEVRELDADARSSWSRRTSDLVARARRGGGRQGVRQQAVRQSRDPERAHERPGRSP